MTGGKNLFRTEGRIAKHIAGANNPRELVTFARPYRFTVGGRDVDLEVHLIKVDGFQINLTQIECKLTRALRSTCNRTDANERWGQFLWRLDPKRGAHNFRTIIKNVRRKLEPDPPHRNDLARSSGLTSIMAPRQ